MYDHNSSAWQNVYVIYSTTRFKNKVSHFYLKGGKDACFSLKNVSFEIK